MKKRSGDRKGKKEKPKMYVSNKIRISRILFVLSISAFIMTGCSNGEAADIQKESRQEQIQQKEHMSEEDTAQKKDVNIEDDISAVPSEKSVDSPSENTNEDLNPDNSNTESNDDAEAKEQESDEQKLCELAKLYYKTHNSYEPEISEIDHRDGDMVSIHLYDNMDDHTATSAWYEIDQTTGVGYDIFGQEINLNEVGFLDGDSSPTQIWTIKKHNTGFFDKYREITYTKEWKTGTVHTVVPQWEVGSDEYLSIIEYTVDADQHKIDLLMDYSEGMAYYEALVIDLKDNIYYGKGYTAP